MQLTIDLYLSIGMFVLFGKMSYNTLLDIAQGKEETQCAEFLADIKRMEDKYGLEGGIWSVDWHRVEGGSVNCEKIAYMVEKVLVVVEKMGNDISGGGRSRGKEGSSRSRFAGVFVIAYQHGEGETFDKARWIEERKQGKV